MCIFSRRSVLLLSIFAIITSTSANAAQNPRPSNFLQRIFKPSQAQTQAVLGQLKNTKMRNVVTQHLEITVIGKERDWFGTSYREKSRPRVVLLSTVASYDHQLDDGRIPRAERQERLSGILKSWFCKRSDRSRKS